MAKDLLNLRMVNTLNITLQKRFIVVVSGEPPK